MQKATGKNCWPAAATEASAESAWLKKTASLRQRLMERGGCRMTLEQFRAWLESQREPDWRRQGAGATSAPGRSAFFRCVYCRGMLTLRDLTVDHDLPVTLGGTSARENLRTCCEPCNRKKGEMSGEGFSKLKAFVEINLTPQEQTYLWKKLAARPSWQQRGAAPTQQPMQWPGADG